MAEEEFDFALLGDLVFSEQASADPIKVLTNKGLVLFFGARWSEPCSIFLPKLLSFHKLNNKIKYEFEIIFCSMDKNEDDYRSYTERMPWWCLPYALVTLPELIRKLKAHNLPLMVVINKDGQIITKNAVGALEEDPTGKTFPWTPNRIVDLLPKKYVHSCIDDRLDFSDTADLDEKYILLYFASYSDALSQEFTPWLMKAYNILKRKRQDFEVRNNT